MKLTKVHLRKFYALHSEITGTSRSSEVNVITIHHRHHCSLEVWIWITVLNRKQDFGRTGGRRVAMLKLDVSPVQPSEQAHGNSGTARVFRGKINRGEKESWGFKQASREAGNISVHISIDSSPIFHFFLSTSLSGLAETKPGRVLHPSSIPLTYSIASSSCPPPAHKRWRLMNSALMHASANCIGIGNSSQYYKMFSPSRWPPAGRPASTTFRRLPSFC